MYALSEYGSTQNAQMGVGRSALHCAVTPVASATTATARATTASAIAFSQRSGRTANRRRTCTPSSPPEDALHVSRCPPRACLGGHGPTAAVHRRRAFFLSNVRGRFSTRRSRGIRWPRREKNLLSRRHSVHLWEIGPLGFNGHCALLDRVIMPELSTNPYSAAKHPPRGAR
ncbi:hypothetical protein PsYK624_044930 [Phanerochaete sordida]|uniref:Uncharacterized protein n=1 Tax=Phanerochaete sordida TaxID=48140 RepID=A0A9P3G6F3_9APHY|nr:hypothetical protein PsYK624_044930 [Phanerochaete sordida]